MHSSIVGRLLLSIHLQQDGFIPLEMEQQKEIAEYVLSSPILNVETHISEHS